MAGKRRMLAALFFVMLGAGFSHAPHAQAVWDGTPYDPEETLDPECSPSVADCRVTLPIYAGENVPAGSIPFTNGTDAWTTLPIGTNGKVLKVQGGALVWGDDNGGIAYGASGQGIVLDGSSNIFSLALDGSSLSQSGSGLRIASSYPGQASITTVGTISAGTWQGTPIAPAYGGTGSNAVPANGQLLIGNGTGYTVANVTGSNGILVTNGSGSLGLGLSIDGLASISGAASDDELVIYDASAGANRSITFGALSSILGGALSYTGTWNATTNSPTLTDGMCTAGENGTFYIVGTAGSTTLGGISSWSVGDWVVCNGTSWSKVANTNAIASIFGRTGSIIAQAGDYAASLITSSSTGSVAATTVQGAIAELASEKENAIATGTTAQYWRGDKTWQTLDTAAVTENALNLYYTDARARSAVSSGSASLSYSTSTGVFAIAAGYSIPRSGNTAGETLVWSGTEWRPTTVFTVSTSTNTVTVNGTANLGTTTATGLTLTQNGLALSSSLPSSTANRLYNQGGTLYWNGAAIADSGSALLSAGVSTGELAYWNGTEWTSAPGLSVGANVLNMNGVASTTGLLVNGVATTTSMVVTGLTTTSGLVVNNAATIASSTISVLNAGIANLTNASTSALSVLNGLSVGASVTSPIVNATAGLRLNGTDINTGGVLSNVGYLNQAQTYTGLQVFAGNATTTGLTVSGGAYLATGAGNVGIGTTSPSAKLAIQANAGVAALAIGSSTATSFIVDALGRVGIGVSAPSYPLDVRGDVSGTVARFQTTTGSLLCALSGLTGLLSCTSDERLKQDITPLEHKSVMADVLALNPVSYRWKTDAADAGLKYGFIAQEVEALFPELVTTDPVTGLKALATGGLMPFVVEALQKQQEDIDALLVAGAVSSSALDGLASIGALTVSGHVAFGEDTVGEAELPEGDRSVTVSFATSYATRPVITITPQGEIEGAYWVDAVSPDSFTIRTSEQQDESLTFSWHAFAGREGFFAPPVIPMPQASEPVVTNEDAPEAGEETAEPEASVIDESEDATPSSPEEPSPEPEAPAGDVPAVVVE